MQLRIYAQKIISFLDEFDIPSAVVAVLLFLGTGTCTDSRVLIYAIILLICYYFWQDPSDRLVGEF